MIPAGYMFKRVVPRPRWITTDRVDDVFSANGCSSETFTDYVNYWKHNGYWLFNSVEDMDDIARRESLNTSEFTLFYYEFFENEFDEFEKTWSPVPIEPLFPTDVRKPTTAQLAGYDVVTFFTRSRPECSPLYCNALADKIPVNRHCLFDTFEEAFHALETGLFDGSEEGPFRIVAVYTVER